MKRNALILLFMLCAGYGAGYALQYFFPQMSSSYTQDPQTDTATAAPVFGFFDLGGKKHNLSDFQGKIVMINFWATWCPPCVVEFPNLIALANDFKSDVVLIAVSSDFEDDSLQRFLGKQKNWQADNILVTRDEVGATANLFQVYRLPETWIIGRRGEILDKWVGADCKLDSASSKISQYLAAAQSPTPQSPTAGP
jgi:thiol-disulfide isomerase/thioredoxin